MYLIVHYLINFKFYVDLCNFDTAIRKINSDFDYIWITFELIILPINIKTKAIIPETHIAPFIISCIAFCFLIWQRWTYPNQRGYRERCAWIEMNRLVGVCVNVCMGGSSSFSRHTSQTMRNCLFVCVACACGSNSTSFRSQHINKKYARAPHSSSRRDNPTPSLLFPTESSIWFKWISWSLYGSP